jgi:hypothetical protein
MSRTDRAGVAWRTVAVGAVACGLLTGCVERRFVITTPPEQAGAAVFINGRPVGPAPADRQFVYYGTYRFTLVHDGYETLVADAPIKVPWYELGPLEFISENMIPWTIRDVRRLHFEMKPAQIVPPEALLSTAEQLRARGRSIGTAPVPNMPAPPVPDPVVLPPGQAAPTPLPAPTPLTSATPLPAVPVYPSTPAPTGS